MSFCLQFRQCTKVENWVEYYYSTINIAIAAFRIYITCTLYMYTKHIQLIHKNSLIALLLLCTRHLTQHTHSRRRRKWCGCTMYHSGLVHIHARCKCWSRYRFNDAFNFVNRGVYVHRIVIRLRLETLNLYVFQITWQCRWRFIHGICGRTSVGLHTAYVEMCWP